MDTIEAIMTRRSIRQYIDRSVDQVHVEKILQAAMQAPSARNTQAWQFIIINQREILNRIADFHPYAEMLPKAPLAIAVCADLEQEKSIEYCALNCAAATENILLAAWELGLGSVWLGIYPREKRMRDLSRLLNLPQKIIPISLIAVGYPAEKKPQVDRFSQDKVHLNRWS